MAPVYQMECDSCDNEFEVIAGYSEEILPCEKCGKDAKRIISFNKVNTINNDASWIRDCLEVVDKESINPIDRAFLKDPSRRNLEAWKKENNLRPMEPGEEKVHRGTVDLTRLKREVLEKARKRQKMTIVSTALDK